MKKIFYSSLLLISAMLFGANSASAANVDLTANPPSGTTVNSLPFTIDLSCNGMSISPNHQYMMGVTTEHYNDYFDDFFSTSEGYRLVINTYKDKSSKFDIVINIAEGAGNFGFTITDGSGNEYYNNPMTLTYHYDPNYTGGGEQGGGEQGGEDPQTPETPTTQNLTLSSSCSGHTMSLEISCPGYNISKNEPYYGYEPTFSYTVGGFTNDIDEYSYTTSYSGGKLLIDLNIMASENVTVNVNIPANYLKLTSTSNSAVTTTNNALNTTANFVYAAPKYDLTVTANEGADESIEWFEFSYGSGYLGQNVALKGLTLTTAYVLNPQGQRVEFATSKVNTDKYPQTVTLTLASAQTTPGRYTLVVPQGFFTVGDGSTNAAISQNFMIGGTGNPDGFPFTLIPANGTTTEEIFKVIIDDGTDPSKLYYGTPDDPVNGLWYNTEVHDASNQWYIKDEDGNRLSNHIVPSFYGTKEIIVRPAIVGGGNYTIVFPAGTVTIGGKVTTEDLTISYEVYSEYTSVFVDMKYDIPSSLGYFQPYIEMSFEGMPDYSEKDRLELSEDLIINAEGNSLYLTYASVTDHPDGLYQYWDPVKKLFRLPITEAPDNEQLIIMNTQRPFVVRDNATMTRYIVNETSATSTVNYNILTDGHEFVLPQNMNYVSSENGITYARTLKNGQAGTWQSLILPFEVSLDDMKPYVVQNADDQKYEVALFESVTKDGDDDVVLFRTLKEGDVIAANTPFIYIPKSTGRMTFAGERTVKAGTEQEFAVTKGEWSFIGTYKAVNGLTDAYALSQNTFKHASNDAVVLNPFRCYLRHNGVNKAPQMKMRAIEPEKEQTGISDAVIDMSEGLEMYDLQGRKVENPGRGLYIVNGQKIVIK